MPLDERAFFTDRPETRQARYQCPKCRRSADYSVRWVRRTRKERLPPGASEEDRAKFAKLRDYLLRVEDEVAREIDQPRASRLGRLRDVRRAVNVDRLRARHLAFGGVHGGVGGGMNDHGRPVSKQGVPHSRTIRDVQLRAGVGEHPGALRRAVAESSSHLSTRAGHQRGSEGTHG